jgi:dTDP-4-dehydrorhamnose 3,5-epimerase
MLQFTALDIEGAWRIDSEPHADERGTFTRLWCAQTFAEYGLPSRVAQESQSCNLEAGTLRGMHFQCAPHQESKWVRCLRGRIYDVLLDLRADSPTYRCWTAVELDDRSPAQIFIPAGVAHGFLTLTPGALVHYSIDTPYQPAAASGVRWDDPAFQIDWPREPRRISQRDASFPLFDERDPRWRQLTSAA